MPQRNVLNSITCLGILPVIMLPDSNDPRLRRKTDERKFTLLDSGGCDGEDGSRQSESKETKERTHGASLDVGKRRTRDESI